VLVDKDRLAEQLKPPSHSTYLLQRPSEAEYQALVEEFWWETTYVAKNLWRDELVPARYSFDSVMKFELLRKMLEWRVALDQNWAFSPGNYGRYLKHRLDADTWQEFAATFVGPDLDENWKALWRTTALFRRIGKEVGVALGYVYPHRLDEEVASYLRGMRHLDREPLVASVVADRQNAALHST
jgi:aminoglycoside 6-adenylyltransferase